MKKSIGNNYISNEDLKIKIEELTKKIESLECIISTVISKTNKGDI